MFFRPVGQIAPGMIIRRYLESVRDEQVLVSASKAGVLAHL